MEIQNAKRALSMGLSLLLVASSMNLSIISHAMDANTARIVDFSALGDKVAVQELPVGASLEDINLPNTLKATVETVEEVEVRKDVDKQADEQSVESTEEQVAESEEDTALDTPTEETTAEETEPAENTVPADESQSTEESVDTGLIDILFPAMVAKAAELDEDNPSTVAGAIEAAMPETEYETVIEEQRFHSEITIENVEWQIVGGAEFDSSKEASYVFEPSFETDYVVVATVPTIRVNIVNMNLKAAFEKSQVVDGVRITVKADAGVFPEGAELFVEKVYGADLQAVEAAVEEERANEKNKVESYTFDIKVLDKDGNEIEPDNSKGQVKVSFTLEEVADVNLETDVYHVKGEVGDLSVDKLEATEVAETTVEAVTDGFSFYTVEFTYNNLQYVMNGDTTVALSEILNAVGLSGEVTAATSDAPELVSVENTENGWMVTAKKAFSTEQKLTVTIGGNEYVIVVTDDVEYQSFLIIRDSAFYNATGYGNNGVWQGSNAQWWCTNYYTGNLKTNFAEYIDGVDKIDPEKTISQGSSTYSCGSQEIKGSSGGENVDKVFFLSSDEYEQYKNTNDMILETGYGLRTVGDGGALSINIEGRYSWANAQYANLSARPALYLKSTFFKAYKDDSGIRYWSSNASESGYTASTNLATEFTNHTNKLKLNDDTYWTVLGYEIPTYTVTFDSNGHGTAPASQNVPSGGKITKPSDPTDPDLAFAGWYKEEACTNVWNFETDTVTAATTLYAKWVEVTKYPIYVGGIQLDENNPTVNGTTGTATYDLATKTLTLNNYSSSTGYNFYNNEYWNLHYYAVIYSDEELTINLVGNNKLTAENTEGNYAISMAEWKPLTIKGTGSLEAVGYNAIGLKSNLKIEGGTLTITGANYGINNNSSGTDSTVISGGNVTAKGGGAGLGISNSMAITGGTVYAEATGDTGRAITHDIKLGEDVTASQSDDGNTWADIDISEHTAGYYRVNKKIAQFGPKQVTGEAATSMGALPAGQETAIDTSENPQVSDNLDAQAKRLAGELGDNIELNLIVTPEGQSKATESDIVKNDGKMDNAIKNQFKDEGAVTVDVLSIDIQQITNSIETTALTETDEVIEIAIGYNFAGKYDPIVVRKHDNSTQIFTALSSRPSGNYQDGTFYADVANNKIYIYSKYFSQYVIAYSTEEGNAQNRESGSSDESSSSSTKIYTKTAPVYRLFYSKTGEHLYTTNAEERDYLIKDKANGWTDEGIAWHSSPKSGKPVYRLFDAKNGGHVYTVDANERSTYIANGYTDEGIAWYASDKLGRKVYKLTNRKNGKILYTILKDEADILINNGFDCEEASFFAY